MIGSDQLIRFEGRTSATQFWALAQNSGRFSTMTVGSASSGKTHAVLDPPPAD